MFIAPTSGRSLVRVIASSESAPGWKCSLVRLYSVRSDFATPRSASDKTWNVSLSGAFPRHGISISRERVNGRQTRPLGYRVRRGADVSRNVGDPQVVERLPLPPHIDRSWTAAGATPLFVPSSQVVTPSASPLQHLRLDGALAIASHGRQKVLDCGNERRSTPARAFPAASPRAGLHSRAQSHAELGVSGRHDLTSNMHFLYERLPVSPSRDIALLCWGTAYHARNLHLRQCTKPTHLCETESVEIAKPARPPERASCSRGWN